MSDQELIAVKFTQGTRKFNAGDVAGFPAEESQQYVEEFKVATYHEKRGPGRPKKKQATPEIDKQATGGTTK